METAEKILAHLQAALDMADDAGDDLIGAHLCLPMQVLAERLTHLPIFIGPRAARVLEQSDRVLTP